VPEKDMTCPCGEYEYLICYEKRGKKLDPIYCPFCGADADDVEIEELEEDDE
jgi:transcription elongation factor Elf1